MAPKELHVEGYEALVKLIDENAVCKVSFFTEMFDTFMGDCIDLSMASTLRRAFSDPSEANSSFRRTACLYSSLAPSTQFPV